MPLEKLQSKNQRMGETHRALYNQLSSFGGGGTKCRWWIEFNIITSKSLFYYFKVCTPSKGRQNKFQT
jgi:hypothetical protein